MNPFGFTTQVPVRWLKTELELAHSFIPTTSEPEFLLTQRLTGEPSCSAFCSSLGPSKPLAGQALSWCQPLN